MNRRAHYRTNVQGESLEQRLRDLIDDLYKVLIYPALFLVLLAYYWLIVTGIVAVGVIPAVLMTVCFLILCVFSGKKYKEISENIRRCRKGLDGERFVGNMVSKLSSESNFVFHDIACKYGPDEKTWRNIDHVIVSSKGIFAIDTKNWSLLDREYNQADYILDNGLLVNSAGELQDGVIEEIDQEAVFLENKVKEWLGVQYPVKRVCIMIGAYVEYVQKDFSKYWIFSENGFMSFFEKEYESIPMNDVVRIQDNLRRYAEKVVK